MNENTCSRDNGLDSNHLQEFLFFLMESEKSMFYDRNDKNFGKKERNKENQTIFTEVQNVGRNSSFFSLSLFTS